MDREESAAGVHSVLALLTQTAALLCISAMRDASGPREFLDRWINTPKEVEPCDHASLSEIILKSCCRTKR